MCCTQARSFTSEKISEQPTEGKPILPNRHPWSWSLWSFQWGHPIHFIYSLNIQSKHYLALTPTCWSAGTSKHFCYCTWHTTYNPLRRKKKEWILHFRMKADFSCFSSQLCFALKQLHAYKTIGIKKQHYKISLTTCQNEKDQITQIFKRVAVFQCILLTLIAGVIYR